MEYEVLPRVDEFCRVDGAEFNFVHIPCLELSSASGISELYHDAKWAHGAQIHFFHISRVELSLPNGISELYDEEYVVNSLCHNCLLYYAKFLS